MDARLHHNMTTEKRNIELLAPAKDLECGMAAIDHGADAVYIGANQFGARKAAANNVEDIKSLADYAHKFNAKVYVTLNTIIYENELAEAEQLLKNIIKAGVDAILVQDMAIVEMYERISKEVEFASTRLPALHASTQTDNRNVKKAEWLRKNGFSRVVLARETSLKEIEEIHNAAPDVELEAFVHGALCVSYSGACYASQRFFKRSANRGECAQFCRMEFSLKDSNNDTIIRDSHLLSLKDLRLIDRIGDLIDAGICSLKIEGRLKDANYVKNVVAAYSEAIDKLISQHPNRYSRASYGKCEYKFTPNIEKTFNRGFTTYFLDGRQKDISSFDTPKAMGEYVGYVKEIRRMSFNVAGTATFANGDGLCFFTADKKLEGFRVNRVENNRLYPHTMPKGLEPGMALYRNNDMDFERLMSGKTAERKMSVRFCVEECNGKLKISASDECGRRAEHIISEPLQEAMKPQRDNIERQLKKLGNTQWKAESIIFTNSADRFFIPSSRLAAIRRELLDKLESMPFPYFEEANNDKRNTEKANRQSNTTDKIQAHDLNIANVANHVARDFYKSHGVDNVARAFELASARNNDEDVKKLGPMPTMPLMTCRFCLRYALGYCVKRGGNKPLWKEPLFLEAANGIRVKLVFNCSKCQMEVCEP